MATLDERLAVCEDRLHRFSRDLGELERIVDLVKNDVNVLGTAAKVAEAVAANAGKRERRVFAAAGILLTALNVVVAVVGATLGGH